MCILFLSFDTEKCFAIWIGQIQSKLLYGLITNEPHGCNLQDCKSVLIEFAYRYSKKPFANMSLYQVSLFSNTPLLIF